MQIFSGVIIHCLLIAVFGRFMHKKGNTAPKSKIKAEN